MRECEGACMRASWHEQSRGVGDAYMHEVWIIIATLLVVPLTILNINTRSFSIISITSASNCCHSKRDSTFAATAAITTVTASSSASSSSSASTSTYFSCEAKFSPDDIE
ncbi:unnamed protein product [Hydatigera taeniaeformis]|uniref:Secreted protein n=1 Tax=Hydatigena taeniaeformis TaxID=6205 RepID=A0A0R3WRE1_HYDTA|nr:unnamed protein product [Hydatigera taeniaeformis]